ncbi:hypothetical protein F5Y17DRAFT_48784 [Xylariaceae sp. FL0594]|nr:hypothetical protein F5Y17DRAFT_48784 [Xylariaceae sp. FL0594]
MSSESQPITHARFAEALRSLPDSSLALKLAEIRQSVAYLDYSNEELRPYAEGRKRALVVGTATTIHVTEMPEGAEGEIGEGDKDCIEAIEENNAVIARMQTRIELVRAEVEARGLDWDDFQGLVKPFGDKEEKKEEEGDGTATTNGTGATTTANGTGESTHTTTETQGQQHEAWRDGTFQTGTLTAQEGQDLVEELMRRMEGNGLREDGGGNTHTHTDNGDHDNGNNNGSSNYSPGPDGGIDL